MLRWLVRSSLELRFLVIAVAATLILFVGTRLRDMPVDALPEFAPPLVEVQTEALGLSAAEVEELVTINLEEILTSLPWLKSLHSKSMPGLSSIVLVFEPKTDIMHARQLVQERLTGAYALPNVSKPPVMLQPLSTTNRAMVVGLSSKTVSLIDMSVLSKWTIMPKLLSVPGVANVAIWGQRTRQLQVQVVPEKLRDKGVTLNQVIRSTGDSLWVSPLSFLEASTPGAGGWIDTPNQRLAIQHVQPITSPQNLAQVNVEGTTLRLGQIAHVVEEHPPLIGDAIVNDGDGLLLVIEKFPGASTPDVMRGVDATLDELRQGLPGIEIDASIYRAGSFIDTAVENLRNVLLIGAALSVLVVWIFLLEWRAVLISVAATLASLAAALLVLYVRGATVDTMLIAGLILALPLVIHEAIATTARIAQALRRNQNESTASIILAAALATRGPMMFATAVMLLATAPLFFFSGELGALLEPLAVSYLLALLAALLAAATLTPALSLLLPPGRGGTSSEPAPIKWMAERYERVLQRALNGTTAGLIVIGICAVAAFAFIPLLERSLVPRFQENDVRITWHGPIGMSLPEMRRTTGQVSRELRAIPGVRSVAAHLGRAVTGDQVTDIESGQIWVRMEPSVNHEAMIERIRSTVEGYPGFETKVESYLTERLTPVLVGATEPIVVRIEGPVHQVLRGEAERVRQLLARIDGITDLRLDRLEETPTLEIQVDLAAAGRVGLKPGDVRRAVATVYGGLEVGSLFEQQKVFEVVVWGAPQARRSVTSIQDFLIDTPDGHHVRLGDIANVRITSTPKLIERDGVSRHIDVRANVSGRDAADVAHDVRKALQTIQFPLEYHPVLLDDYSQQRSAAYRALFATIAGLIGIYVVLQAYFGSWRFAGLFMLYLAASLAGGTLAMLLSATSLSLGSLFGFLTVLGLAARSGMILTGRYRELARQDATSIGSDLVRRGTLDELGSMLTTAAAIAAVLVPVVVAGPVAGLEIAQPMAIVVLGGLVAATLLNLVVLPSLYLRFGKSPEPDVIDYVRSAYDAA